MAVLESCPKHNMVAYLEKTEKNAQFHEIVDFLTRSSIYYSLTAVSVTEASIRRDLLFNDVDGIGCHVTPLFANMLTQAVVDEGKGSEQPTEPQPTPYPTHPSTEDQTPVKSPHDSHLSCGHTSDRCTNLSNMVLALEAFKDAQAAEILTLKTRIKKLEKRCKPSISHHRAWLKSMSFLSKKKRLSKKESGRQSNETKKLNLDVDTKVITKDKGSGEKGGSTVSTARPNVSTARPDVSTTRPDVDTARQEFGTADPTTPPTTTTIFDDEEMTLADTLIKLKDYKAKGVAFKYTEDTDRPARSILTLKPLPTINPKDKGKGVLEEPEPAKKMTKSDFDAAQIAKDKEVARQLEVELQAKVERERQREEQASMDYIAKLYDEVQARIDADHELAVRWSHEEQEKYTVDE
ncbi:hypothetical protein Tco_0454625, partial [Tanacetum coccineum]